MAQITLNTTGVASNGSLVLQSNGTTTAVTIDTSQNVGIGATSPTKKLSITGTGNNETSGSIQTTNTNAGTGVQIGLFVSNGTQAAQITLAGTGYTTYGAYAPGNFAVYNDQAVVLMADNPSTGIIKFATGGNTERARFNSTGALVFAGGTTTANGIGITFPATQSASSDANTLDDYEEGTWTPGVSFGGGTTGITYTEQNGRYTKIGRQVTVTANVTLSSKGSSTGDATLTGLPFTNTTTRSAGSIYIASVTFADSPSILVEASNTIAYFRETTNAGVATDLTNADFANNSNWTATITYFV